VFLQEFKVADGCHRSVIGYLFASASILAGGPQASPAIRHSVRRQSFPRDKRNKKGRFAAAFYCYAAMRSITTLQRSDVLGLRAFFALTNREGDLLTFSEGFETAAVDGAEMHEQIRTAFLGDESETFGLVEPFDGASAGVCHED
jgi:hypothetical protein